VFLITIDIKYSMEYD